MQQPADATLDLKHRLLNYSVSDAGCFEWQGYVDRNGYGRVYDRVRQVVLWAHRASYEIHKGTIPDKHEVDHVCQNTLCMNPDHLDAVTKVEHVRRTFQRLGKDDFHLSAAHLRRHGLTYKEIADALGLADRGSAAGAVKSAIQKGLIDADEIPSEARLTDSERADIRDLHAFGINQGVLGAIYGVDSSHVSRICAGKRSGHR